MNPLAIDDTHGGFIATILKLKRRSGQAPRDAVADSHSRSVKVRGFVEWAGEWKSVGVRNSLDSSSPVDLLTVDPGVYSRVKTVCAKDSM